LSRSRLALQLKKECLAGASSGEAGNFFSYSTQAFAYLLGINGQGSAEISRHLVLRYRV
jgi:hypothetical protein